MDCDLAARVLLDQTTARPSRRAKARARQHFRVCERCRGQLRELWSAVHANAEICASVQERLPHYLDAIRSGGTATGRFSGLAEHLACCDRCHTVYDDLRLKVGDYPRDEAIAPAVPEPDLSFLPIFLQTRVRTDSLADS